MRGPTLVRTLYSQFKTCCWTAIPKDHHSLVGGQLAGLLPTVEKDR